ncbi:nitrilase-related carbon-nitrogen hydrolase [Bacteroidota bacterium]
MMIKIALIQQKATQNIKYNIQKGLNSVREAAEAGAKIICFPELSFTPFYPQKPSESLPLHLAETIPGYTTDNFSLLAKDLDIIIILNLYELEGNCAFDSSPLINTDGEIISITRMIHITDYPCFHEKEYYTPGNKGVAVCETKFGRIGIAICYDRHYPEYMRTLALQKADIVFIPQAGAVDEWPEGLFEAEMRVASFQNGYFSALCNRVGVEECLTFSGESFVCDPTGKVIAQAKKCEEDILICDVDLELAQKSHARKLFLNDRRPELYRKWIT